MMTIKLQMNQKLHFLPVPDQDLLSGTNSVPDRKTLKQQALERYLERANKDPVPHIEIYSPGRRNTEYYLFTYRLGKKVKRIHIYSELVKELVR